MSFLISLIFSPLRFLNGAFFRNKRSDKHYSRSNTHKVGREKHTSGELLKERKSNANKEIIPKLTTRVGRCSIISSTLPHGSISDRTGSLSMEYILAEYRGVNEEFAMDRYFWKMKVARAAADCTWY